jgi:predicted MFS family arabinose efflux permease
LPEPGNERARRRAILLMAVAAFASGFSLRVSDPLLPQIALEFNASVGAAAAIVTAYAIPYGFTQAYAGLVGDRLGKCQAVAATCAISCVLVLLCAFSQSLPQLTVARFICAPAAATIIPLGMAYVGDVVPYERRQTVLARFLAGQMTGMIAGQISGGIIGDHFGWRTVFFVLAGIFALAAAALVSQFGRNPWMQRVRRTAESGPGLIADYRKLFANRWARFLCVAVFIEGAVFFGGLTYVSAHLHAAFALSFSVIGAVVAGFGVGSVLYAISVRRLVGALGERGLVIGGGVVGMFGYLTLAGAPVWQTAPLATIALGFGYYMLHNTLQTSATQVLPEARGTAVAGFSSALFLGQSTGVASAAPIVNSHGTAAAFAIVAVLWPILAIWIARRLKQHRRAD